MRNKILIPSAVVPNAYYLGPMDDPDLSDFINQETNQILFKQSVVICLLGTPKLPLETDLKCLRDEGIGSVGYQRKRLEIEKFMT